jgi:general secretion pathway protein J
MKSGEKTLGRARAGFTLVEILVVTLILSLLALMSYRGLGAVLEARQRVAAETEKWRRVTAFLVRFEEDVQLAAPRPVREASATAPAWRGVPRPTVGPQLEFSRFGSAGGLDAPRRVAYGLNAEGEIELWLWPALDVAPGVAPARFVVLAGVRNFSLQYLDSGFAWVNAWPGVAGSQPVPRAVHVVLELQSGESIERIFALRS